MKKRRAKRTPAQKREAIREASRRWRRRHRKLYNHRQKLLMRKVRARARKRKG